MEFAWRSVVVLRLVLGEGVVPGAIGLASGLVLAAIGAPVLRALLYGVSSHDVTTFSLVAGAMGAVVVAATFVPARRATQVDPAKTMRGW